MQLNTLRPAKGSKKVARRVGRGTATGVGKTCGRGHKGQKARSGGFHKVGFEGGQMPFQRRVPKSGFTSRVGRFVAEVRLHELAKVADGIISVDSLKQAGIISKHIMRARIIASGELSSKVTVRGVHVTPGAKAAIEAQGGSIEA